GRLDVDEVDLDAVDLGRKLRKRVEPRLGLAPVVIGHPEARELLQRAQLHALRPISDQLGGGPPRRGDAAAQFGELVIRNLEVEGKHGCGGIGGGAHDDLLWSRGGISVVPSSVGISTSISVVACTDLDYRDRASGERGDDARRPSQSRKYRSSGRTRSQQTDPSTVSGFRRSQLPRGQILLKLTSRGGDRWAREAEASRRLSRAWLLRRSRAGNSARRHRGRRAGAHRRGRLRRL